MNSICLATIEIPQFITKIPISNKARPKYYSKKSKKIPPTYKKKYTFDKKGYLVDTKGNRILANPRTAGKPKYENLSGNKLISGYSTPFIRNKIAEELHKFYRSYIQNYYDTNGPIDQFPLQVTWDLYTTLEKKSWDASNLFFYYKYFEDTCTEVGLIPDDSIQYITWSPGPKLIPINLWENRKFVFKFFYDERRELKQNPWI